MRDELQGLPFELHVLGGADGPQARHHGLGGDAAEIEALAARVNGLGHLLGIGGGQDEHHVTRRLLQRLQQRVEGGRREHVHLVDDVYLVAPARRRELHAPDDLLANVLHAGAARGVQLVHIGVLAGGDHLVDLSQQVVHFHAVDHAGLLHRLTPGGGAAQAVHADVHEQGRGLGGDGQNITNDGVLCNGHGNLLHSSWVTRVV